MQKTGWLGMGITALALGYATLSGCALAGRRPSTVDHREQVFRVERAFAKTMADRDHAAFLSFLSQEAVFFTGGRVLRGPQQVGKEWRRFYEGEAAPFSWEPEQVEVLDSGSLALSSGPVRDPRGKQIGTFTSIWRLEAPGTWRIIFDKGCKVCDPGS